MQQTPNNLNRLYEIYQIIKNKPFSDKEKWCYIQLCEIKGEKTNAELVQFCRQRPYFIDKFVAKLREKKLYPIPLTILPQKPIPIKNPVQVWEGLNFTPPPPPKPTGPHCETCGLEGKVAAQRGRPVMHGIELFQEDGRILCATCRTKMINPKHGTEEQRPIEDEEEDDEDL